MGPLRMFRLPLCLSVQLDSEDTGFFCVWLEPTWEVH